jgi:hypothetical protein
MTDFSLESFASMAPEELQRIPASAFAELPEAQLRELMEQTFRTIGTARQEQALLYYQPVSAEAEKFHYSTAPKKVALGGNGSSKSETQLVDIAIEMTGVIPRSLEAKYPKQKLRPPIHARLIVQSHTTTWDGTMKPKLQWNQWTGLADGVHGHWGWIPRRFLLKGKWEESWSEKYRTLTLNRNGDYGTEPGSTLQIFSHSQDVQDFASSSVHRIGVDEGPRFSIWRENVSRLREGGYISLAMTPPDDESAAWDAAWVYDELYVKGLSGPAKNPFIDSFTFHTEDNKNLDPAYITTQLGDMTPEQREVRLHGHFMHLGGRIYPTYTNRPQWWCFGCNKITLAAAGMCATCGGNDLTEFCHLVAPFDKAYGWPVVYLLDPHPRKPYMMAWFAFAPYGDIFQIGEMECDLEPAELKKRVDEYEREAGLRVMKRIIDPNMAESPAHNAGRRHVTVRDELDAVGLRCDLGMDDFAVGKTRVKTLLTPNPRTRRPTLHVFTACAKTDYQMMRYSWQEWSRYSADTKDPKAVPMDKNSDFPTLIKYLANAEPTYAGLMHGGMVMQKRVSNGRRMGY